MSNQDWPPGPGEPGEGSPPPGGAPPPPGGAPPPPTAGAPPPSGAPGGAGPHPPAAAGAGADLMTRFLGRLIDWVLLFIVSAVISAIFIAIAVAGAGGRGGMMSGAFGGGFSVISILVSLIPGAYFIGMLAFNDGRTVGKMLVGLQVRSADGTPLDASKAFQREWWNLLLVIPFFLGNLATAGMAIFIAVSINNGQPWHDQQARTYEVKTK